MPPPFDTPPVEDLDNRVTYCDPDDPLGRRVVIGAVEKLTGQPKVQRLYERYLRERDADDNFWQSAVDYLRLTVTYDAVRLAAMPATGPLIVIANHPFGVIDGIAIGYLVSRVRNDMKVIAHAALGRAHVFRPYLIPIEFDGSSSALRSNVASKRAALQTLDDGGALIVFPAGRVSTADTVFGAARETPWKLFTAKLVEASGAPVVPIFFEGQNGPMFQFVSKFSDTLREALILREVVRRIGGEVSARIGDPLSPESLTGLPSRQALLDHLRDAVVSLGDPPAAAPAHRLRRTARAV